MTPDIEISGLSFAYPDGQSALNAVDLSVQPGERVALLGPNGAGKSTLLLHLNGILKGSGDISICGLPVNKNNLRQVRLLVGMVFQSPDDQLFSTTVYDDVAYSPIYQGLPEDEIENRVSQALSAVQMEFYRARMPYHLSLGEKKRIAVATVLSMQPRILAFDEPTSGMDPRARRSLIALLETFPHTLLIATHDLELARALLPRSVVLDGGRVAADGSTSSILANSAFLEAHGLA